MKSLFTVIVSNVDLDNYNSSVSFTIASIIRQQHLQIVSRVVVVGGGGSLTAVHIILTEFLLCCAT